MSVSGRLDFLDRARGLIMIFMALDHALFFWSFGRVSNEGLPLVGNSLTFISPAGASGLALTVMFLSSLCAPGFLFIAGYLQALSVRRREEAGASNREIRSHLILRGISLIALQILAASPAFNLPDWRNGEMGFAATGVILSLSVLSTIGSGLILLAVTRRLRPWQLLGLVLAAYLLAESRLPQIALSLPNLSWVKQGVYALFLLPVPFSTARLINNNFPVLPWLVPMCLGWWFGHTYQQEKGIRWEGKRFLASGLVGLTAFIFLRLARMGDYLQPKGALTFFFLSKYPPSPLYYLFYLGILFLLFFLFLRFPRSGFTSRILEGFGKTPLFFYVTHLWVYALIPTLFNRFNQLPLLAGMVIWLMGLIVLYPLCRWYLKMSSSLKDAMRLEHV